MVRDLTAAWSLAWSELSPIMREALVELAEQAATLGRWPRPWEMSRLMRLGDALLHVRGALDTLSLAATSAVSTSAALVVETTAAAEPAMISSQLPATLQATTTVWQVPPTAMDAIVARVQARIASTMIPLSPDATEAMRRALVHGVALGTGPRATADRMLTTCRGSFNGGLSRALNISRTEILDAYRVASRESHAANADLVEGWQWLCALDVRSCPSCIAKHGSTYPTTIQGPLDHQSGRCSRLPVLRPWRQLGINLDEPASVVPDARAWFSGLPQADRVKIMGRERLALLDSGLIGWDDIPQLRTSAQWRDSYGVKPLSQLRTAAQNR